MAECKCIFRLCFLCGKIYILEIFYGTSDKVYQDGSQSPQILLAFLSPGKWPCLRVRFYWLAAHTVTGAVVATHTPCAEVKATAFTIACCSLQIGVILCR